MNCDLANSRKPKGWDPEAEIKHQAAERWVCEVIADTRYGTWQYAMARKPEEVRARIGEAATSSAASNAATHLARLED